LGNEKPESEYPIRSLHDFLLDVEKELKKFRRMSIIGAIASLFILIILGRFIHIRFLFTFPIVRPGIIKGMLLFDLILIILALACLFYSIYALLGQNAFLKRWGERFKKLHTLEQRLLDEKKETK
jgi:hypothetical protein